MLRVHATEHFFATFRVHRRQFAHHLVAALPFRILTRANADRQKRRDDPNGKVRRSHEKNKGAKTITDNQRKITLPFSEKGSSHQVKVRRWLTLPKRRGDFSDARSPWNCRRYVQWCF